MAPSYQKKNAKKRSVPIRKVQGLCEQIDIINA